MPRVGLSECVCVGVTVISCGMHIITPIPTSTCRKVDMKRGTTETTTATTTTTTATTSSTRTVVSNQKEAMGVGGENQVQVHCYIDLTDD